MLSKLAVKRLTKLANFMDALPRKANKHFNMGFYFFHDGEHKITDAAQSLKNLDCGTVSCALGWAAIIPEFQRAGLRLQSNNGVSIDGKYSFEPGVVKRFFDGDFYADLFSFSLGGHIRTPKQWAKHCRKFIKDNTRKPVTS